MAAVGSNLPRDAATKTARKAQKEKQWGTMRKITKKLSSLSKEPMWLQIARKELGVKEQSGKKHNPRILEYHGATTLKATSDETAWCSSFVSWCLEVAGIKSTQSAAARSYLKYGKRLTDPKIGCIVVLQRGTEPWQGHVALYVGSEGSNILCLGGNQGNSVSIARYPKNRVLGYRWPE